VRQQGKAGDDCGYGAGEGTKPKRYRQIENAAEKQPDIRQNRNSKTVECEAKAACYRDGDGITPPGMETHSLFSLSARNYNIPVSLVSI
jgi:hypothetical protein